MIQKLAIARAIIHDPELVLMDEPYSGLDIKARETLNNIISRQNKKGTSFFLITHDLDAGFEIATRCGLLVKGKIALECKGSQKGKFGKLFRKAIRGDAP
jgi:heme exporter protein A